MANPTLSTNKFSSLAGTGAGTMTMGGTQAKIAILAVLCIGTGAAVWETPFSPVLIFGGAIVGFVLALVVSFNPAASPFLAPLYAIAEGAVLGGISSMYERLYHGIILQAVLATGAVFCATLAVYVVGLVRPTERFVSIVSAATGGVVVLYLASFVLSMFHITLFQFSSPVSILVSVVICGIAAANLIVDYGVIDSGIQAQAPKYMEWYAAFGLLVTVVWLYLEILRLLAKINSRD